MKTNYILLILIALSLISCNDKNSSNNIEVSKIEEESKEIYKTAILLIMDSKFNVDIDSIDARYKKLENENPELALKFAKDLKEYGFDLQFKKLDNEFGDNKHRQADNSKAGKIQSERFTIADSEKTETKALVKKLSEYSTQELKNLPNSIRLTLYIVVPYDITKDNLENTLKSIVTDKSEKDKDIDEIIIFAYDDKNDIGKTQYTFGKLLWAPYGKTGNITPDIARNNDRSKYRFEIIIKEKVGNINETDLPTKRELKIYNEMMDEKYIDMQEEEYHPTIMKKFNVKTKKELMAIWLKVASHKN